VIVRRREAHRIGRFWPLAAVLVAVMVGATLAPVLLVASPAQAAASSPQPGNLVVNGDAETGTTAGWTGGLFTAQHGVGGYAGNNIVGSSGDTGTTFPGGTYLFAGGNTTSTQTIDLTPSAGAIDHSVAIATVGAYLGGYQNQADDAAVSFSFQNAAGTALSTVNYGPATPALRGNATGFIGYSSSPTIPVGVRKVVVTVTTRLFTGGPDGYFDNISLVLNVPPMTANPDTGATTQPTAASVFPAANDVAGTAATIDPTTVRFVSGTTLVTTLTNAQGTYTVNTASGQVAFYPVAGFSGTTTPITYQVADTNGQTGRSTITINVTAAPAPALTLVKSASPTSANPYTVGQVITYSFLITNSGNTTMSNVAVTDPLPGLSGITYGPWPGGTAGVLDSGDSVTGSATLTITPEMATAGSVMNTASVTGDPSNGTFAGATSNTVTIETHAVPPVVPGEPGDGSLAFTGTDSAAPIGIAIALMLEGLIAVWIARSRRRQNKA
jgi:uncharacterized repeat protein (TIGR01451 family)